MAALAGLVTLRTTGPAFLIVTMMLAQAFYLATLYFNDVTGGDQGFILAGLFAPLAFLWLFLAFLRRASDPDDFLVFACNFTPVVRHGYQVGVPGPGWYREVMNSDSELYGGSNVGNAGGVEAQAEPSHGRSYSLRITLPPLALVVFRRGKGLYTEGQGEG